MKKDSLGDRMKEQYENRYRIMLPRRTYVIIRVDGKSFHTLLSGAEKPFDELFKDSMQQTAIALCKGIQGAQFAYVQSDEISVLVTDFNNKDTDAWFDGNLQKIVSVSASIATATFNYEYESKALFDSRAFIIPDPIEVANYFIWRQKDAERNSIQMIAQSLYSHKELHQKKISDLHDMLHEKGHNWNDYSDAQKRGSIVYKQVKLLEEGIQAWWEMEGAPIFTQSDFLTRNIPSHGY